MRPHNRNTPTRAHKRKGRNKRRLLAVALLGFVTTLPLAADTSQDTLPGLGVQPVEYFYTGKPYDADTESYTFKFRNYDPELNRWTTADPIGFYDSANCYIYVPNPISSFDYMGLFNQIGFFSGLAEFSGGIVVCGVGAGMMTAGSPTIVVAAGGALVTAGGIISIGAGMAHMIEAFHDTYTWIPTTVQGTVLTAIATLDGQLTEQEIYLIDAFDYLTGELSPSPEATAILLDIQSSVDAINSLKGSFDNIRNFIEAEHPETGDPGYE